MRKCRDLAFALALTGVFAGMVAIGFAAVPLYRLFYQATSYDGATERAETAPTVIGAGIVAVRFNTEADPTLSWRFFAERKQIEAGPGETTLVHFQAENLSDRAVTGTATFSMLPVETGQYFDKIRCFCFTERTPKSRAGIDMPVRFFVDPAMLKGSDARGIDSVILSYTFFRAGDAAPVDAALYVTTQPAASAAVMSN